MRTVHVVVIGFGLSAIPLIRELERTNIEFVCISDGRRTIWDELSDSKRLDFDLVSNPLTSFFSFDLVSSFESDDYPTAEEFYAMQLRWRRAYQHKIVRDRVLRVDNFRSHSVISTASGETLRATHVVFATGFDRSIHSHLNEIDYHVSNRTFVLDTMGDSANLIISKLAPNNKIIVRTNGFYPLEKVMNVDVQGTSKILAFSEYEFHNLRYVSQETYNSLIFGARPGSGDPPFLLGDQFPDTVRSESGISSPVRPANGTVLTKYWPIDLYALQFSEDLENAIRRGYLLNDIAMWILAGKIIVVPKTTPIDFERNTIQWHGFSRSFDDYIPGGDEHPRLPEIMVNGRDPFRYLYRNNFMGVVPAQLNNIYFIGFTRPMTGGAANVMEMQALLVHKLIAEPEFQRRIHSNLTDRITAYNRRYYGDSAPGHRDHVVFYGFYNDEIARLIGIDHRPQSIYSLSDLLFYYAFPNDAYKYRAKGEYAVDGIGDLIAKVGREYGDFVLVLAFTMKGMAVEPSKRQKWLRSTYRHVFNDMRHRERHRPFLSEYIRAYRKVTGIFFGDAYDAEWEAMAAHAAQTSRQLASSVSPPATGKLDEDVREGNRMLFSLLRQGKQPLIYALMQMDRPSQNAVAAMLNPQDYDLPFLRP